MSKSLGRLTQQSTAFFICDVQEKFRNLIHHMPSVIHASKFLIKSAEHFKIPVVVTEQNPKGLGKTVPEIELGANIPVFSKMKFSMFLPDVSNLLQQQKIKSVVLAGIEAHVCVQQTAFDLLENGYEVHLVADGVSSTRKTDRVIALERMKNAGAFLTTSESVVFELMKTAEFPGFKAIQTLLKEKRPESGLD